MIFNDGDIIVAPATPTGGALCVVRMSGEGSIALCDSLFQGRCRLCEARHASAHYGVLVNNGEVVDDVIATIYRAPHSYTGEEGVEISTHGSRYIVGEVITLLLSRGARMAEPGEFTRRAFLAGRMDLSQAEAVADVIASDSKASFSVAATQMRGGYSAELGELRDKLLHISSLLELELDFSEEDVEFADRGELYQLLEQIRSKITQLTESFALGNALKEGVTVAIAGRPNVGKSTLLNRLVGEDRAMVSDIAGTTRDTVEAVRNIGGVLFRFVDTAGLHATDDRLEMMGIERAHEMLKKARIILWLTDGDKSEELPEEYCDRSSEQKILRVVNKIDLLDENCSTETAHNSANEEEATTLYISAKRGDGVDTLLERLHSAADATAAYQGDVIVSNQRHYEALCHAREALEAARKALSNNLPSDLLSEDIRQVMYHLGTITGEITSQDVLQNIFSKFCIGK